MLTLDDLLFTHQWPRWPLDAKGKPRVNPMGWNEYIIQAGGVEYIITAKLVGRVPDKTRRENSRPVFAIQSYRVCEHTNGKVAK